MSLTSEFAQIMQKAEVQIAQTMNTTFVDGLHEEIKQSVKDNVYAKYFPKYYIRRDYGGIMNENYNRLTEQATAGNLAIVIENTAPGNAQFEPTDGAGQPADSVENDGPWNYPLTPDPGPRPFMEEAAEKYVGSGMAEAALRAALASI